MPFVCKIVDPNVFGTRKMVQPKRVEIVDPNLLVRPHFIIWFEIVDPKRSHFCSVTNYLLGSSSNATFTIVSHEEARAIKITNAAHRLTADLWKILEEKDAYTETKRANVEPKKTLADSCREDFKMKISLGIDTEAIFCILQNIKFLLTKVIASKRVEMQARFSRLSAKSKTVVNKMVVDMKNQFDIKQRTLSVYFDEITLSS